MFILLYDRLHAPAETDMRQGLAAATRALDFDLSSFYIRPMT
jgi:hypothetical protein